MIAPDVRRLVQELQAALGVKIPCGQLTLNMNNGDVDSVDVRTKVRVPSKRDVDPRRVQ